MDFRNECSKFLSAECPNNCHYDDWCKHIKAADEMFSLSHFDLGLDDEEVEGLMQDSTFPQRLRWLNKKGFELGSV